MQENQHARHDDVSASGCDHVALAVHMRISLNTTWLTSKTDHKHSHECNVESDLDQPEGNPTQSLVEHAPCHLWEPEDQGCNGTGKTCASLEANRICGLIRGWVGNPDVVVQYGGSVNPGTIDELMAQSDIDGVLVGGASLDPVSFARIADYQVPVAA